MVRLLLSASAPSVLLLSLLLSQSPPPASGIALREILTSAFGSWSPKVSSDSRSTEPETDDQTSEWSTDDDAEIPEIKEEEEESGDGYGEEKVAEEKVAEEEDEELKSQNQQHTPHTPMFTPTVRSTITKYIQVTSTKRQIPMCVTAHVAMPICSETPEGSRPPRVWGRMARSQSDAQERPGKSEQESASSARMFGNPLHLLNPFGSPPATNLHLHVELPPILKPHNSNHPPHSLNPLHGANTANLIDEAMNGALNGGVDLTNVLAGSQGWYPGSPHGNHIGTTTQLITKTSTITHVVTKVRGHMTATLVAHNCLPASEIVPHCRSTAVHPLQHHTLHPQSGLGGYYEILNPPYEALYTDPWHLSRGRTDVSSPGEVVQPSARSIAAPTAQTPPLSMM